MATLAHNLDSRRSSVWAKYPGMTIYWIGDPAHQSETSDHNPDSRSIVHALDFMTYTDIAQGNDIVSWLLSDPRDLEYVIFNRTIWPRSNGFKPKTYTGSNPHTDHVHTSGKHGSVGENAATGTGYDTEAEKMTPEGMITGMEQTDKLIHPIEGAGKRDVGNVFTDLSCLRDWEVGGETTAPGQGAPPDGSRAYLLHARVKDIASTVQNGMTSAQAEQIITKLDELISAVQNSTGAAGNYDAVLTRKADA